MTPLAALLLLAVPTQLRCDASRLAPWFVVEPPARVEYAAARGAAVRCAARGNPTPDITWTTSDGAPLHHIPNIRRVHSNGTLEVSGGEWSGAVRCRAANAHGVAVSRLVSLLPVPEVSWEMSAAAVGGAGGGVAALLCRASHHARFVHVALWYKDDRLVNIDTPSPESRFVSAGGALLVRAAGARDAGRYACLARHRLTGDTRRSAPAHLPLTAGAVGSAPRLVSGAGEVTAPVGGTLCLPCAAADHPPPHFTWYRERSGRLQPVEPAGEMWLWAGGAALCFTRVTRDVAGAWLCKAYNAFGDVTAQIRIHVPDTLTVTVDPPVLVADMGSTVRVNCMASEESASLSWLHDGAPAGGGGALLLRGVARAHVGLYQCFATTDTDAAHASLELRLGDSPPELSYTFIEQALRGGGRVSLRCAAVGAPPPAFTWLLDDRPLDQYRAPHRYVITEETATTGEVVSVLNVSASASEGGRYTCRAANRLGHADHSARLNIYGPPSVRAVGPVRVVAGANATIYCPYAGYPISSVSWWRRGGVGGGGAPGAVGGAGRVSARGAALLLAPALPPDAGHYACTVTAPPAPPATADIEIHVRNPPKISPFMFSSELTEGSSVQVLCGVSSGDKPMYFSWFKDGSPLPPNLQIEEKSLNEFSLLMFSDLSARHSGEYTCRVSNHAATVNYTAALTVKVAPAWQTEPQDAAVLLGAPIHIECAAKGYPVPTITWYRKIVTGDGGPPEGEQWEQVERAWGEDEGGAAGGVRVLGGKLRAAAAARAHRGLYRCTADNGVGPALVKHVNLTVHEPAHFEETSMSNVSCVSGHSVTLACHALGDPPLLLHWTHGGARVDLNSYRWTVSEVRTAEGVRSSLQLRAAERPDSGEYRCHAHNTFGRSEILMYLTVEEPPEAPGGVRLGGVGARWVRVVWRAPPPARRHAATRYAARCTPLHRLPSPASTPAHTQLFNLTLELLTDNESAEGAAALASRVEGLQPAVAYSLRLLAGNHVGESPQSDPLMFTTLEEAPSAAPLNAKAKATNPGELLVSWAAPPQDSWNGELLGYVVTWREEGVEADAGAGVGAGTETAAGWSSVELVLGGLRSAARYALQLRAYNRAGAGPPAPTLYVDTVHGAPETAPKSISCDPLSARSLRVRWARPPSILPQVLRGYVLHYTAFNSLPGWSGTGETMSVVGGGSGEAALQGLAPATNYSVWVRARSDAGLGPPAPPLYCATHEDVPGVVERVRALAAGEDAVRVTWLPPAPPAGRLTHYMLYTREFGKSGGEWSQRVEATEEEEVWREVRGLRAAVYELWVRAATAAGLGPPSRPVTAAPALPVSARISSFSRVIYATRGTSVRLRCAAVGTPPIRWRWSPLLPAHTLTDTGDLIIHKVESHTGGNYTCTVRNAGGMDALVVTLGVSGPPAAPAPRLQRAEAHALHVAWDAPPAAAGLLGYSVQWSREEGVEGGSARLPPADTALALRHLACGTLYKITLRAHNAVGASAISKPLLARTRGDKAKAAPGKEFVWANSSSLRLNLLSWRVRCAVSAWRVALRPAAAAARAWSELRAGPEAALALHLRPATWYEIRVVAHSSAGDTVALYRAPTHTINGERIGEPTEMTSESLGGAAEAGGGAGGGAGGDARGAGGAWRTPALAAAALATLTAALTCLALIRRRCAWCPREQRSTRQPGEPHPQLYTTEPSKRNGKTLTPPGGDIHEISPYATFSMAGGAGGGAGAGCALHLHTFGRAEPLDLAAPPPRPNLLSHSEYGRARDSDSESSGSPCAACAAELYRLPAAHLSDTLPAADSSDTSCSGGARAARPRHARHPHPTIRSRSASRRGRRSGSRGTGPLRRLRRSPAWLAASRPVHAPPFPVPPAPLTARSLLRYAPPSHSSVPPHRRAQAH